MEDSKKKCIYDPLQELISYYSTSKEEFKREFISKEELSIEEKLKNRIIDGDKTGLQKDLDTALLKYTAIEIINDILLKGMKTVGELFGSGQMQLPFVLQSAECMKSCVSYLEQFMEKTDSNSNKGTIVLATVKGDVHDIGKNLVDIILTNNGYKVINLGIKCPLEKMISAYIENKADAIGMSGLLVKSTAIMKENLEQMNERDLNIPVILGGAALNRRFVEGELRQLFKGDVYYANDAFDGLKHMDNIMEHKKQGTKPDLKIYIDPRDRSNNPNNNVSIDGRQKSSISLDNPVPEPPFLGCKIVKDIPLDKAFEYINETALFKGSWNVYQDRHKDDSEYENLIKEIIYPKYNELRLKVKREKLFEPKVIYGYYPCQSEDDNLFIFKPTNMNKSELFDVWKNVNTTNLQENEFEEWIRFSFPRQKSGKFLCISDFFKRKDSNLFDVVAFQIVTIGEKATEYCQKLYNNDKYQEYLLFHGLSVETAEGLAEYWHKIIRKELKIDGKDSSDIKRIFQQGYQGSRYSFGYPACPNLEDNKLLFEILKPERIGITLTEEFQMVPEQSTNAIIVHHPEARYFFIK